MAAISRIYVNEAGPCDSEAYKADGEMTQLVQKYLDSFQDIQIVTYKGEATKTGKELITSMLANHNFNEAVIKDGFQEAGIACACNPAKGMSCMMMFANGVRSNSVNASDWMKITEKD